MQSRLLVIDGHDGAGKTTLASSLARILGGAYVRPFTGERGLAMLRQAEAGKVDRANLMAREMVEAALTAVSCPILVLDRHWMTVLTLLPERLWEDWLPIPPTLLCWNDLETTLERLARRSEAQPSIAWHEQYLKRYYDLARRFAVPVVRTDHLAPEPAVQWALEQWAAREEEP